MEDIYRDPTTNNYDVNISVDEWKEILQLPQIQNNESILPALEKWYFAPNYTGSCKFLGEQYGYDYNFFSVQNMRLGKIAVNYINRFRLIGENGKETYWAVAWIELKKENGVYILQLRPELVKAIGELHLFQPDIDITINKHLQSINLTHEDYIFPSEQLEKPKSIIKTLRTFSRSLDAAKIALKRAGGKCEFNASHETFPRQVDGSPYLEMHHLIPLKYANDFEVSIDVHENIVCLCSTCHNRIHYGQNNREIIEYLWNLRKNDLRKREINIELSQLLTFYSIHT